MLPLLVVPSWYHLGTMKARGGNWRSRRPCGTCSRDRQPGGKGTGKVSILASMAAIMGHGAGRDAVPLRDYIDRGMADLAKYHDATVSGIQAEIDRRLGEIQRETDLRLSQQAAAVSAATAALDRRLDAMNEFREQIRDTTARKVDTDLYRQASEQIGARLENIESMLDRARGRMSAYAAVSAFLVTAVTVLTLVLNHIHF